MIKAQKFVASIVATIVAVPLTIYALSLALALLVKAWKVGWEGTPLIFIGGAGICSFVSYGLTVAIFGCIYANLKSDKGVWVISLSTAAIVALYGLAFAYSFFGVLTVR